MSTTGSASLACAPSLEIVSQACLEFISSPPVVVALPRTLIDHAGLVSQSPCTPVASPINTPDEEPQTARKLVLRKRTTSPYQVKFPFMTGRVSVRKVRALTAPANATDDKELPRRSLSQGNAPFATRCLAIARLSTPLLPAAVERKSRSPETSETRLSEADGDAIACVPAGVVRPGLRAAAPTFQYLPAVDTWTEICEDLSRAMEVLAVLTDLDHSNTLSRSCSSEAVAGGRSHSRSLVLAKPRADAFLFTPWCCRVFPSAVVHL